MYLNRVVVASDEHPSYLPLVPLAAAAWKKFFDITIDIAFVSKRGPDDLLVLWLSQFGTVKIYSPNKDIPDGNLAKVSRLMLAGDFEDDICMVCDVDTIPLQREFTISKLIQRKPNHLLAIGAEFYNGTPHYGKFPMGMVTAEGHVFKKLMNPQNLNEKELIESFSFQKKIDGKENVKNPFSNFSDESLLRSILTTNSINVQHIKREPYDIKSDIVSKGWWELLDIEKLHSGGYYEANLCRLPLNCLKELKPIIEYIGSSL